MFPHERVARARHTVVPRHTGTYHVEEIAETQSTSCKNYWVDEGSLKNGLASRHFPSHCLLVLLANIGSPACSFKEIQEAANNSYLCHFSINCECIYLTVRVPDDWKQYCFVAYPKLSTFCFQFACKLSFS